MHFTPPVCALILSVLTSVNSYTHSSHQTSFSIPKGSYAFNMNVDTKAIKDLTQQIESIFLGAAENVIKTSKTYSEYETGILTIAKHVDALNLLTTSVNSTQTFLTTKRQLQYGVNESFKNLNPIEAHWHYLKTGKKYMDLTYQTDKFPSQKSWLRDLNYKVPIPTDPTQLETVKNYIKGLDKEYMEAFLTKLTSFYNRYYRSQNGANSAQFIYKTLDDIIKANGAEDRIELSFFKHSWPQSSIIARFKGNAKTDELVVVGAHQDSINQWIPWFGKAPGADDDGSGTTSTVSSFKALVESKFAPNRTVEFHWYAAEEAGLLGSQDIAQKYNAAGKQVVAMMHFDMTGHYAFKNKERIAIVQDFTDPELTSFLRKLVDAYTDLKWVNSKCGYACSDHASWNKYGFRSAFPIEDPDIESNPNIHSTDDVVETISFHHVEQFAKLAVAFAVELSAKH